MKKWIEKYGALSGLNLLRSLRFIRHLPRYLRERRALKEQAKESAYHFPFADSYPCLFDRYEQGGVVSGHYFHQDLLVASEIFRRNPVRHIDVGSRIDGFVAHVASFRVIEIADIRQLSDQIANIRTLHLDIMQPLPDELLSSTDSLSSLHVLEHLGLGRYGDPLDWEGHLKGFRNLVSLLSEGGIFYFSVPIGPQRIEFNAHRVFSVSTLLDLFEDHFTVEDLSYVDDHGSLHRSVPLEKSGIEHNFGCRYGCGIFILRKKTKS